VPCFEGGSLIPNKSPGRLTFADVTIERDATKGHDLFDWFQDVARTSSGLGLLETGYKRNLDIAQHDRDGTTLGRWSIAQAWSVKFAAGESDNKADENVIESVILTYDYFELVQQRSGEREPESYEISRRTRRATARMVTPYSRAAVSGARDCMPDTESSRQPPTLTRCTPPPEQAAPRQQTLH